MVHASAGWVVYKLFLIVGGGQKQMGMLLLTAPKEALNDSLFGDFVCVSFD
jgi:hypothetical protein